MSTEQGLAFAVLGAALVLFAWGRWRYDVVAVFALLAVVGFGLVPATEAFNGFAHPAVITVAAVLIISRGLQNAGIVDFVGKALNPLKGRENLQLAALCIVVAFLSSFMNNVGALALMLPLALRLAYRDDYSPAKTLMPLAFASLLGGLVTLIGTPPNIIVASFRENATGTAFGMFDFAPVGITVAAAGLVFLVTVGWRLLPRTRAPADASNAFAIEDYITEAQVPEDSQMIGRTLFALEELARDEVTIIGLVRDDTRWLAPSGRQRLQAGDILILRGDTSALQTLMEEAALKLAPEHDIDREALTSEEVELIEAVVTPGSRLIGRTLAKMRLRTVYGINVLALARQGRRVVERLRETPFHSGDVLLLQVPRENASELLAELQCLPLAGRSVDIGRQRRLVLAGGLFAAAILAVMMNWAPVHIAFTAVAAALVGTNVVRPTELYTSIDWPVIVLLGAMFPVGGALEATGGTGLVAGWIQAGTQGFGVAWVILVLFVGTMFLSDVINNNATAVVMAPIAIALAERLGASPDAFLMAVAIGASCAFLTPIGHQSNTLVMEPGGYRFSDYWRMGLPLELVITLVAVPMLLIVWPPFP
jgi:di/tricarboxylate transporter